MHGVLLQSYERSPAIAQADEGERESRDRSGEKRCRRRYDHRDNYQVKRGSPTGMATP